MWVCTWMWWNLIMSLLRWVLAFKLRLFCLKLYIRKENILTFNVPLAQDLISQTPILILESVLQLHKDNQHGHFTSRTLKKSMSFTILLWHHRLRDWSLVLRCTKTCGLTQSHRCCLRRHLFCSEILIF